MAGALRIVTASSLIGACTALSAWVATLVLVGNDGVMQLRSIDMIFGWEEVLGATTGLLMLAVLTAMRHTVEPLLVLLAGGAGFALLYKTRRFPFLTSGNYQSTTQDYWAVVAAMVVIFAVLLVSLRLARQSADG